MHPHHHRILLFLARYKYQVIFPIAVLEGPIVTIISGILIARGDLHPLPTFAIIFAADMVSDPALYLIGRFGRHLLQKIAYFEVPPAGLRRLERQFERQPLETMIVGKLSYGLGSLFVAAAGAGRMPWVKFLEYIGLVDACKSCLLLLLGYFYGRAILHLSGYLQYYAIAVIVLVPFVHWQLHLRRKHAKHPVNT
ncbi:MAG: DedA family protein [Elusimicrobiota bacterium]